MKRINERKILQDIKRETARYNIDNISRTIAYLNYYREHKEIWWALLASLVSRNAGWNMTDLASNWFRKMLNKQDRYQLFLSYERANWLIFEDAYPQLLIYELSKKHNMNLFHLLSKFSVASFMQQEWEYFFKNRNIERLTKALIINEQFVIHKPVIEHPYFAKNVYQTIFFKMQQWLHFSYVLFPTFKGTLYGITVEDFTNVEERIILGKQLMQLLFKTKFSSEIRLFATCAEITGSRQDYEQYMNDYHSKKNPTLRTVYPIINHQRGMVEDWSKQQNDLEKYFADVSLPNKIDRTKWYKRKNSQLYVGMRLKEFVMKIL